MRPTAPSGRIFTRGVASPLTTPHRSRDALAPSARSSRRRRATPSRRCARTRPSGRSTGTAQAKPPGATSWPKCSSTSSQTAAPAARAAPSAGTMRRQAEAEPALEFVVGAAREHREPRARPLRRRRRARAGVVDLERRHARAERGSPRRRRSRDPRARDRKPADRSPWRGAPVWSNRPVCRRATGSGPTSAG